MTEKGPNGQSGLFNGAFDLERHGFRNTGHVHWNYPRASLFEAAIRNSEGRVSKDGALVVETGIHTGRSAQDKFIVAHDSYSGDIWWDNNKKMDPAAFDRLYAGMISYAQGRNLYVQDLYGGADPQHRLSVRVVTEYAWHSLFINHLLIRPPREELAGFEPGYLIIDMPGFEADPQRHGCRSGTVIACDFERRVILIGGTSYAGEIKKSVFTILNYLLPGRGTMPMHCSANTAPNGGNAAVFFGLSGTGKTTLSADPKRTLVGDDEHGWSENGIFNFEGGCYAKMIRISESAEPEIFATTKKFGTVLENVVMDTATRDLDFDDAILTENTRAGYPLHYIPNASETGQAGHPETIIMLTCDAFGVMPPIARLTPDQAMYHFLAGYTAKVAGTEKDVKEPTATFSACFGAPFMPLHPSVYGNLLREKIARHDVKCWLVNTGWTGGAYGVGKRMPIAVTRALLEGALSGRLNSAEMREDPIFGFEVPVAADGVDPVILTPRETWGNKDAYDTQADQLAELFSTEFRRFESYVDEGVRKAGPKKV